MSEPFLGEIKMVGWNFAARGWAFCDGQLLPISQNTALFSLLGTTFGGDGRTTFGLPDMRGRVPMHPGTGAGLSPRRLGQKLGAETHTQTVNELASHNHSATTTVKADELPANSASPGNNFLAEGGSNIYQNAAASQVNMNPGTAATTVANTGGSQAFNIIQPSLCVNFEIALAGIFPSRS